MTTYVLMAGLPGTGKSTLAHRLAAELSGIVLDKDRVRAALFPGRATDYTEQQDDLCVEALLEAAAYLTSHGTAPYIFIDGRTFSRRGQIEHVLERARQAGAAWRILYLTCDDVIAEARLARGGSENPAANRNASLYRSVKARFEPIAHPKLDIDTSKDPENYLPRALSYLRESKSL
jgi:predicted kinase